MPHSLLMNRVITIESKHAEPHRDMDGLDIKIHPTCGASGRRIDLDILPTLIGFNLRRAQIEVWRDFGASVGGAIRPGLFSMMLLIGANPGIAQVDLANQLGVDKASIVALVDRLEAERWVERRRSAEDRRRQEIYLTAQGAQQLAQLKRQVLEHDARFRELFSADEQSLLMEFLARLRGSDSSR